MTSSEIETAAFRVISQCLKQLLLCASAGYKGRSKIYMCILKKWILDSTCISTSLPKLCVRKHNSTNDFVKLPTTYQWKQTTAWRIYGMKRNYDLLEEDENKQRKTNDKLSITHNLWIFYLIAFHYCSCLRYWAHRSSLLRSFSTG
jgi:hypothetical protein